MKTERLHDPARVAELLDREGMSALVALGQPHVRYLSGFPKAGAVVLARHDLHHPRLIVAKGDIDFTVEGLTDGVICSTHSVFYRDRAEDADLSALERQVAALQFDAPNYSDKPTAVRELLAELGLTGERVGVDTDPTADSFALSGAPVTFQDATNVFAELRTVKIGAEIERLADAARITELGISAVMAACHDGMTQRELAAVYTSTLAINGATIRVDSIGVGRSSVFGNANVADDVLKHGDVIRFDLGSIVDGYWSDISRCYAFGEPTSEAARLQSAMVSGQQQALDIVRAGVPVAQLFSTAVEGVRAAGVTDYRRTHVGHGIGLAGPGGYDDPKLTPTNPGLLQSGMVLCVETPYYRIGLGGFQIEDMVVVTDDGYELLTHLPRGLEDCAT